MAFRRGGGIRYPSPPLSGGSKLNNSTCCVEKKKTAAPGPCVVFSRVPKAAKGFFFFMGKGNRLEGSGNQSNDVAMDNGTKARQ